MQDSSGALTLTERILGSVQTTGPSNSEVQFTLYSISTGILIKLSVIKVFIINKSKVKYLGLRGT